MSLCLSPERPASSCKSHILHLLNFCMCHQFHFSDEDTCSNRTLQRDDELSHNAHCINRLDHVGYSNCFRRNSLGGNMAQDGKLHDGHTYNRCSSCLMLRRQPLEWPY